MCGQHGSRQVTAEQDAVFPAVNGSVVGYIKPHVSLFPSLDIRKPIEVGRILEIQQRAWTNKDVRRIGISGWLKAVEPEFAGGPGIAAD